MSAPALSVVVCTLDRAAMLDGCLTSLATQRSPDGTIEVIVVDNGSTDRTAEVVRQRGGVRYVSERARGLSRARNTGLEAAKGDLVAFVDDDARPENGWASALIHARRRWSEAAAFGGPVELDFVRPRPPWLGPDFDRLYSAIDLGPVARLLEPDEQLVGTNLAVLRAEVLAAGGFAIELGRVGARLRSEEEVDLLRRMRRRGASVAWEPAARVRHIVDARRMTRRWMLRRSWAQGCSDAISARLLQTSITTRPVREVARALARGWPTAARDVASADTRQAALMREVSGRLRRAGRAVESSRRPSP